MEEWHAELGAQEWQCSQLLMLGITAFKFAVLQVSPLQEDLLAAGEQGKGGSSELIFDYVTRKSQRSSRIVVSAGFGGGWIPLTGVELS